MPRSANVRSFEAIRKFKAALVRFEDDASSALASLRMDLDRTIDWIDHDRPRFWQQQLRSGHDKVDNARSALARCRMRTIAGRHPSCIDEQVALRKAQRAVEAARQKVDVVRHWKIKLHQETDEYRSHVGLFEQRVYQDLPKMIALVEGMLTALEAYASTTTPADDTSSSQRPAGDPSSNLEAPSPTPAQAPADEEH
jgi:hypothetical protein